jgi:mycothiol synthase
MSACRETRPERSDELRFEVVSRLTLELQARVNALAHAARAADHGVSPFGEHKWLRLIRGDEDSAAVLLWRGTDLLGAADCDVYPARLPNRIRRLAAEAVVHPAHRRQGLGRRLIREVAALAGRRDAAELHLWAYGNGPAARRLAAELGFAAERRLLQMYMPRERLPEPPPLPRGLRVRAFDPPRDAYRWLAIHNRVFADHPEQSHWYAADLQARLEQPWFNPNDLLLVENARGTQLHAFCWTKISVDATAPGEIYILGVDPSARGEGLGRLATSAGLAHIAEAGRPAMLYVEAANRAAVRMYTGLGFEPRHEHVCYRRALTSA